ncbi:MAG: substrate-binding domain-containing protein [Thermoproteus sp.]
MDAKMLAVGLVVGLLLGFAVSYAVLGASRAAPQVQTVTMTIGPQVQTVTVTATGTSTGAGAAFTVGAAGTLKFSFNELLSIYSQLYPSVALGQPLYEGSGKLAQDESVSKQFAVVAAADTTTIPSVLFKNGLADYEIAFGLTQMAIIVNLNTTAGQEVYELWKQAQQYQPLSAQWNSTWRQIFEIVAMNSTTKVGVSDPFTDPSGYQAICMIKLAGLTFFGNSTALYNAIYGNPSKYVMRTTETDLLSLMPTGQIQFILSAYLSNAIPQAKEYRGLAYITLPPQINLGSLDYVQYYHSVNVTWTEAGQTKTLTCNPIIYTITIPKASPNPQAAVYFIQLIFSPQGQNVLKSYGIQPIVPGVVYGNYSNVPAALRPFVVPLSQVPQYAPAFPS